MIFITHPHRRGQPSCPETTSRLKSVTLTLCHSIPVLVSYYSEMTFVDVTGLAPYAVAIDRFGRFYYNADILKKMTNSELAFVIQHETLHVLVDHPRRVQKFYHLLDNYLLKQMRLEYLKDNQLFLHVLQEITAVAADIEVDFLIPQKVDTVFGPFELRMPAGHEAALALLRQCPGIDPTCSMEFNSIIALKHFSQKLQVPGQDLVQATDSFLLKQHAGQLGSGSWSGGLDCGQEAFGHPKIKVQHDLELPNYGNYPAKPMDMDDIKRQIIRDIQYYSGSEKGNLPSKLIWYIEEVTRPKVDYLLEFEEHMQHLARRGWREKDTMHVPPIFAYYEELATQGFCSEPPIPEPDFHYSFTLGILVDTSNSVSDDAQVAFARESVAAILNREMFSRMVLCSVDAGVHFCQEINHVEPEVFKGNGGADLVKGFTALLEENVDAILVFTDRGSPWPEFLVDVPVVVVSHRKLLGLPPEYCFIQLADPDLKRLMNELRDHNKSVDGILERMS